MHQNNGNRPDTIIKGGLQARTQFVKVQRFQHGILCINPLGHFLNTLIQHFRKNDLPVEQAWARLIGYAQLITKPLGDNQQRAITLALQQRVGGHGGAHLYRINTVFRHRLTVIKLQQIADSLQGGIFIGLGIFRQQLVGV